MAYIPKVISWSTVASGAQLLHLCSRQQEGEMEKESQKKKNQNILTMHTLLLLMSSWLDLNHTATYTYKKDEEILFWPTMCPSKNEVFYN